MQRSEGEAGATVQSSGLSYQSRVSTFVPYRDRIAVVIHADRNCGFSVEVYSAFIFAVQDPDSFAGCGDKLTAMRSASTYRDPGPMTEGDSCALCM